MRLYEFSKESGIATKQLLELLKSNGFEVKSHMSVLSDKELGFLKKELAGQQNNENKPQKKEVAEQKAEVKEKPTPLSISPSEAPIMRKQAPKQEAVPAPAPVQQPKPVIKTPVVDRYIQKEVQSPVVQVAPEKPLEIVLEGMPITVAAQKMERPVNDLILTLLKLGVVANKNQFLSAEIIGRLASQYQIKTVKPVVVKQEVSKGQLSVENGTYVERKPVVVVIGHVDHGKTTLLDYIRKTRVAAKEKGGITQHLGAYEAHTEHGNIVFIDTPGHEAFSKMRVRGIKSADIAVLVVAADDGVMPQTVEAIKHAKQMQVPIIVAINKIDKADPARIEIVKRQLAQQDLLPEDWGGQTVCVGISAKDGTNINQLLEMILLTAQIMELKADVTGPAKGYILEAKIEKGRGPVATFLSQHGILKIGDYFVAGSVTGKVSSLVNSAGERLKEAGPSVPVLVAGFDALPEAGDYFEAVSKEQQKKATQQPERKLAPGALYAKENTINLIIKTDANSSKEALVDAIEKLSKKAPKSFTVVHAAIGAVSESDVLLAANTQSAIVTLHVKTDASTANLAQKSGVKIESFEVIYKLLERLEEMAEQAKEVIMVRKKIGEAIVLKVFDIKDLGVIAGAQVKDGRFSKDGLVVVYRGNKKIGEGKIKSLQRDRKSVKEVHTGFECAFMVENYNDWAQDDRVECYLLVPEE